MKEKYIEPQLHAFYLDADLLLASEECGQNADTCTGGGSFTWDASNCPTDCPKYSGGSSCPTNWC